MPKLFKVYKHTNKIPSKDGIHKVYIGVTCRKLCQRWANGKGYTHCIKFYRAIKKYGWSNFEHETIAENLTCDEAFKLEEELIATYRSTETKYGYNISKGGQYYTEFSDEVRRKIKESKLGGNNPNAKAVINVKTLETFSSAAECRRHFGMKSIVIYRFRVNPKTGFMYYSDYMQLSENKKKEMIRIYEESLKKRTIKNQVRKKVRTYKPWNKGKKCPKLSGCHNGMFGIESSLHPRAKKIVRISDGKIYGSIKECADDNERHVDTIRLHCSGKTQTQLYKYFSEENK